MVVLNKLLNTVQMVTKKNCKGKYKKKLLKSLCFDLDQKFYALFFICQMK